MSSNKRFLIFFPLMIALTAVSQTAGSQTRTTLSCKQAMLSKPGVGVAYSGDVSIDDYKLRARIPDGLTGWGGVATDAPFHGFTIFLDPLMHGCIVFKIHLRIDDDEAQVQPHTAKTLSLGDAAAWQIIKSKRTSGLINITTYFSSRQDGQVDDGTIMLISGPLNLQKTKSIYDTFLRSVSLGGPHFH